MIPAGNEEDKVWRHDTERNNRIIKGASIVSMCTVNDLFVFLYDANIIWKLLVDSNLVKKLVRSFTYFFRLQVFGLLDIESRAVELCRCSGKCSNSECCISVNSMQQALSQ
ncbi:hypothetical protein CEXT_502741 [Caerostris extrusa]|uniref:Uncharacterized protein n=1 Tax=Caerostris extrusa TaxID=172846 RepID=A0AAV4MWN8_CAEEX|nr:hypothetical protein CEXT_502741 [Caerostris extrusa]